MCGRCFHLVRSWGQGEHYWRVATRDAECAELSHIRWQRHTRPSHDGRPHFSELELTSCTCKHNVFLFGYDIFQAFNQYINQGKTLLNSKSCLPLWKILSLAAAWAHAIQGPSPTHCSSCTGGGRSRTWSRHCGASRARHPRWKSSQVVLPSFLFVIPHGWHHADFS